MSGFWVMVGLILLGWQLDHGLCKLAKAVGLRATPTKEGEE